MNLRLGISHLNIFTPSLECARRKEKKPKSRHFPVSKNKMLATLHLPHARIGPFPG
jgi:hypothetical protein